MQTRSMAASTKITKFRQIGQRKCKMIYKASKRRISNKGEKTTGLAEPLADKDVYL